MVHIDRISNMKKLFVFAAGLLLSVAALAQTKDIEYNYSSFSKIAASNDFQVSLVTSGSDYKLSLQVEGAYAEYVVANVNNGTLEISLDEKGVPSEVKKAYKGKTPTFKAVVTMPVPPKEINIKDKVVFDSVWPLELVDALNINASDNSVVKPMTVTGDLLYINLDKKASAEVVFKEGSKVSAVGSGNSKLNLNVQAKEVEVAVNANAETNLKCESESLDYTAKGTSKSAINGSTYYAGFTVTGTANVNAINLETPEANIAMNGLCSLSESASEKVKLSVTGGANLSFNNNPTFEIENIKNSSVVRYAAKEKKEK